MPPSIASTNCMAPKPRHMYHGDFHVEPTVELSIYLGFRGFFTAKGVQMDNDIQSLLGNFLRGVLLLCPNPILEELKRKPELDVRTMVQVVRWQLKQKVFENDAEAMKYFGESEWKRAFETASPRIWTNQLSETRCANPIASPLVMSDDDLTDSPCDEPTVPAARHQRHLSTSVIQTPTRAGYRPAHNKYGFPNGKPDRQREQRILTNNWREPSGTPTAQSHDGTNYEFRPRSQAVHGLGGASDEDDSEEACDSKPSPYDDTPEQVTLPACGGGNKHYAHVPYHQKRPVPASHQADCNPLDPEYYSNFPAITYEKSNREMLEELDSVSDKCLHTKRQLRLTTKVQRIMEKAIFSFMYKNERSVLHQYGIETDADIELNRWTKYMRTNEHLFGKDGKAKLGKSLHKLLINVGNLRNIAAHRIKLQVHELRWYLQDCATLAKLLEEHKIEGKIRPLLTKLEHVINNEQQEVIFSDTSSESGKEPAGWNAMKDKVKRLGKTKAKPNRTRNEKRNKIANGGRDHGSGAGGSVFQELEDLGWE